MNVRILFECSKNQNYKIEKDLKKQYVIVFNTPLVCKTKEKKLKENCFITYQDQTYVIKSLSTEFLLNVEGKNESVTLEICSNNSRVYNKNNKIYYESDNELQRSFHRRANFEVEYRSTHGIKKKLTVKFGCNSKQEGISKVDQNSDTIDVWIWTSRACIYKSSVDCETNGKSYNNLRSEPYYEIEDKNGKFYLSICQSLPEKFNGECKGAAACFEYKNNTRQSIGYLQSHLKPAGDDAVIVYTGGHKCNKMSSVTINFLEKDGFEYRRVDKGDDECNFYFEFLTTNHDKNKRIYGKDCSVTDPVYHHKFDLGKLKEHTRKISTGSYNYFLNVCEKKDKKNCGKGVGACQEIKQTQKYYEMGKINDTLEWFNQKLRLTYKQGSKCHEVFQRSTVIDFICDRGEDRVEYVVETEECEYQFEWYTKLACRPSNYSVCSYKDSKGNIYDFSHLTKSSNNYIIRGDNHNHFALNLCAAVIDKPAHANQIEVACPENSSICMIKPKIINLGYVSSTSFNVVEGKLSITMNANGYTTIILCECSKAEGFPKLFSEEKKNYTFTWSSKYFCPIKSAEPGSSSKECKITDPETGYVHDLSTFSSNPLTIMTDEYQYKIGLCQKLQASEAPCSDSFACQTKKVDKNFKKSLASKNVSITIENGNIYVKYTMGDICTSNKNRNITLEIKCPENNQKDNEREIKEHSHCNYKATWYTRKVCREQMKCSVDDNKDLDFSNFILDDSNYISVTNGYQIYFNLCSRVQGTHGCPANAFACLKTSDGTFSSLGYGTNKAPLEYKNGKVYVKYKNGDICKSDPNKKYSSTLILLCGADTSINSDYDGDCNYKIYWSMPRLCTRTCSQGLSVDYMLSLKNFMELISKSKISMENCLQTNSKSCSVLKRNSHSYGSLNNCTFSKLNNGFSLNFYNGDKCDNVKNRSSRFTVVCSDRKDFIRKDVIVNCERLALIESSKGCEIQKKFCGMDNLNLNPLSDRVFNVSTKHGTFYIGICSGIGSIKDCPRDSVVCLENKNKKTPVAYIKSLKFNEANKLITYTSAPENYKECGEKYAQVNIMLKCNKHSIGSLKFIER